MFGLTCVNRDRGTDQILLSLFFAKLFKVDRIMRDRSTWARLTDLRYLLRACEYGGNAPEGFYLESLSQNF